MPFPLRSTTFSSVWQIKIVKNFHSFSPRAPRLSTEGSPCTTTAAWHPHFLGDVPKGEVVGCVGVYTVIIGPAHGWLAQSERNLNALAGLNTRINELRGRESKPGSPSPVWTKLHLSCWRKVSNRPSVARKGRRCRWQWQLLAAPFCCKFVVRLLNSIHLQSFGPLLSGWIGSLARHWLLWQHPVKHSIEWPLFSRFSTALLVVLLNNYLSGKCCICCRHNCDEGWSKNMSTFFLSCRCAYQYFNISILLMHFLNRNSINLQSRKESNQFATQTNEIKHFEHIKHE